MDIDLVPCLASQHPHFLLWFLAGTGFGVLLYAAIVGAESRKPPH